MDRPNPATIPELITQAGVCFGENVALIERREDRESPLVLSYRELFVACWQACRGFIAAGVVKGDRVAIWAPNISEWVVATLGLQLAGGVLVPINTRLKGTEAAYILKASRAKMLLTVSDFLDINYLDLLSDQDLPDLKSTYFLRGDAEGGITWSEFLKLGDNATEIEAQQRAASINGEDILDIIFTSGTTGKPKGVITTHRQNLLVYMGWGERIGITPEDRYLIINPFYHTFGYKAGWLTCLLFGAAILPAITFDVTVVMETIERDKVSVMPGPPTIFQTLLSEPRREDYDLSSLRLVTTGATTVPVTLVDRIRNELGIEDVRTAYGLTESCGVVSVTQRNDDARRVALTSGCPLKDIEVKCVDSKGQLVANGEAGEIWVKGYNVMDSYLDNPQASEEAVDKAGWLHTGDVGVIDYKGYIQITDRLKDMFIVGGFNCYPAEVEQQITRIPGVDQVAVVGADDERMGEVGHAYIVKSRQSALTEQEVVALCKDSMANYKVPRRVIFVDKLPRNTLGKVMKNVLVERSNA